MPRSPKRVAKPVAVPAPEQSLEEKIKSDLKGIAFLVAVGSIILFWIGIDELRRPSPRPEPTSYNGVVLTWDVAKAAELKKCPIVTVDIDPRITSKMRVEKDGPNCVDVSMIFRLPLDWEITGESMESIPYPDVIHPNNEEKYYPFGWNQPHFFSIPAKGIPYWAYWTERQFQIVYDKDGVPAE